MSACATGCGAPGSRGPASDSCPRCGEAGRSVGEVTLRSLLTPGALEERSEDLHRFCATPTCPVVYFGGTEVFERGDLIVPVFQKQTDDDSPACYCFGITRAGIRRELTATGRSTAMDRVRRLVRADRCACELRNPQGSCCLGNVMKVVEEEIRIDET